MDDKSRYRIQLAHDSLNHIRSLKRRRDAAVALAEEFSGIRGIDYTIEQVASSSDDDALVNLVERRKERKAAMDSAIAEYDGEMHDAWRRIESIDNSTYVQLLTFRYLKDWSWERVSCEIGYSVVHTRGYLKEAAMLEYYEVMDSRMKAPKQFET